MPIVWYSKVAWFIGGLNMKDKDAPVFQSTQAENFSAPLLSKYNIRIVT